MVARVHVKPRNSGLSRGINRTTPCSSKAGLNLCKSILVLLSLLLLRLPLCQMQQEENELETVLALKGVLLSTNGKLPTLCQCEKKEEL